VAQDVSSAPMPADWNGREGFEMAWFDAGRTLMTWGGTLVYGFDCLPPPPAYTDTWYGDGVQWRKVAG
jgi:hypothetical protein